jgi:hypothetical protein
LHCVVISPHYEEGTNTGKPVGRNECHVRKMDSNREEMKTNPEKRNDGQEEMKTQMASLASRIDVNK